MLRRDRISNLNYLTKKEESLTSAKRKYQNLSKKIILQKMKYQILEIKSLLIYQIFYVI